MDEKLSEDAASDSGARWPWIVSAAVVALLGFLAYRPFLDLAFLGLDTFPMILSGRILSFQDLVGTFTEELMDGMYPDGHFYRPVANLAFAFDYAVGRLAPRGYHITDLVIVIANATLVSALARKLFGSRAVLGAFVAGLVFVLHPVQLELVPVPPRRADALCSAFLLACLLVQPEPGRGSRRRGALVALLALLSVGSKETGAVVVPLVVALQFLRTGRGPWKQRALVAARHGLPPFMAVLAFVIARTAVLDGLGGHAGSSIGALAELPNLIKDYAGRVFYPQPIFGADLQLGRGFVATMAIALFLGGLAIWRWPATSVVREREQLRAGFVFLGAWAVCLLVISSLAGRVHDWYAMLFVAPYAIALGMLVDRSVALIRRARPLPAILPLAASLVMIANHITYSALLHDYEMWPQASRLADEQIVRYQRLLAQGRPGQRAVFDRFIPWLPPPADGRGVRGAYLHADHSLQAYTELVYPDRAVHVDFHTQGPLPPSPSTDVLQVILFTGPASALR